MAGKRRWMDKLGLVSPLEHQDPYRYGHDGGEPSARAIPPPRAPRDTADNTSLPPRPQELPPRPASAGVTAPSRQVKRMPDTRVHVVRPIGFSVGQEIGDRIKQGTPVVVSVVDTPAVVGRRLIDFCSACVYMVDGRMQRVAKNVFLLTPGQAGISNSEKQRLKDQGLYTLEI